MIERAEVKLRLDQVVIQQGRLSEAQKGWNINFFSISHFFSLKKKKKIS